MKRKQSTHMILIPRLMTPLRLKQINKASDCIFQIPASHPFWPNSKYESLVVALLFPYLKFRPYQLKGTPKMFQMGRLLSKMFKEDHVDSWNILFKFSLDIRKLQSMQERMVWKLLYLGGPTPFPHCISTPTRSTKNISGRKREIEWQQIVERKKSKSKGLFRSKKRRSPDDTV